MKKETWEVIKISLAVAAIVCLYLAFKFFEYGDIGDDKCCAELGINKMEEHSKNLLCGKNAMPIKEASKYLKCWTKGLIEFIIPTVKQTIFVIIFSTLMGGLLYIFTLRKKHKTGK